MCAEGGRQYSQITATIIDCWLVWPHHELTHMKTIHDKARQAISGDSSSFKLSSSHQQDYVSLAQTLPCIEGSRDQTSNMCDYSGAHQVYIPNLLQHDCGSVLMRFIHTNLQLGAVQDVLLYCTCLYNVGTTERAYNTVTLGCPAHHCGGYKSRSLKKLLWESCSK